MSSACSFIFMQINHFHKNSFALRLALKQRHKGTRKWPFCPFLTKIAYVASNHHLAISSHWKKLARSRAAELPVQPNAQGRAGHSIILTPSVVYSEIIADPLKKHEQYKERNTVDNVDISVINYHNSLPPSSSKHTQPRLKISSHVSSHQLDRNEINFVTVYEFLLFSVFFSWTQPGALWRIGLTRRTGHIWTYLI